MRPTSSMTPGTVKVRNLQDLKIGKSISNIVRTRKRFVKTTKIKSPPRYFNLNLTANSNLAVPKKNADIFTKSNSKTTTRNY